MKLKLIVIVLAAVVVSAHDIHAEATAYATMLLATAGTVLMINGMTNNISIRAWGGLITFVIALLISILHIGG